ncbi:MAG: oxidoreductase [Planctomycetaceae bacterium]|nr:oxidoreductase [Planctomycetaceae bacterium]
MSPESFPALVLSSKNESLPALQSLCLDQLPDGEVVIRVNWSSLNYKDALAATGHPGVVRNFPHVPGLDAAGVVVASEVDEFHNGQEVLVTGYELGSFTWGGWSHFIRVPAAWVIPLPEALTQRAAMEIGTAGFTAAMCLQQLERNGLKPEAGAVVVTGATGGVGCQAVQLLSRQGYHVVASTGKADAVEWLKSLGAREVVGRDIFEAPVDRPLGSARWGGAIDTVGGRTLVNLLRETQPFGCVAACGVVGGADLDLTVHPFILRGILLSGVSASLCPRPRRDQIWERLADSWRPTKLDDVTRTVSMSELIVEIRRMLAGQIRGRIVIDQR